MYEKEIGNTHSVETPVSVVAEVEEDLRCHDSDVAAFYLLYPILSFPKVDSI
jgi:hypothetical protein